MTKTRTKTKTRTRMTTRMTKWTMTKTRMATVIRTSSWLRKRNKVNARSYTIVAKALDLSGLRSLTFARKHCEGKALQDMVVILTLFIVCRAEGIGPSRQYAVSVSFREGTDWGRPHSLLEPPARYIDRAMDITLEKKEVLTKWYLETVEDRA